MNHASGFDSTRFSNLTPTQRRLLDLVQHIWFGRIEDLIVRDGQPVFDRPPRVILTIKLAGQIDPRPVLDLRPDRPVTYEQRRLLAQLRHFDSGLVRRIEIAHGKPLFAEFCGDLPPAA